MTELDTEARLFGLLIQNTTHWVAYKQQKFISHSAGGWEVPDQVPAWLSSSESPLPGPLLLSLLMCHHMVESDREFSGVSSLGP